ncbi:MAG: hypothetical protein AAFZ80_11505 [Cyanobacteria bacterium P01_A01_bin.105]
MGIITTVVTSPVLPGLLGLSLTAMPALAQTDSVQPHSAQPLGQPQRSLQPEDLGVGGERPTLVPDYAPVAPQWTGWVYSQSLPLSSTTAQSGPFVFGNHCENPRQINLICRDIDNLQLSDL